MQRRAAYVHVLRSHGMHAHVYEVRSTRLAACRHMCAPLKPLQLGSCLWSCAGDSSVGALPLANVAVDIIDRLPPPGAHGQLAHNLL